MPTLHPGEARKLVRPELLPDFEQTLADAETEGMMVYSVTISSGVPLMYAVKDES